MRLTIGRKLFLGFGTCVAIIIAIVCFNFYQLNQLNKLQDQEVKISDDTVVSQQLRRVSYKLYQVIAFFQHSGNTEENNKIWEERKKEAVDCLNLMKEVAHSEEEKNWFNDSNNDYLDIVKIFEQEMLPLIKTNADRKQILAIDEKIKKSSEAFNVPLRDFSDSLEKEMHNGEKQFDQTHSQIITISIILAIIGVIFAIAIALIITRVISKPINKIVGIANNISEGNLNNEKVIVKSRDEINLLANSFNKMGDSLNDLLSQVNIAVEQVAVGSEQVSSASQSLSQGATEQASSLEEITSSMGEINSQTIQNSENANKANELANHAMENAKNGNEQMAELVKSMSQINKSAQEIKKIVKAIDDIAFQINLLALNANVEAARAGKYGKGFAVVADEVRNLAVRSTGSVKETTSMVEEATKNIEEGNKLVELTAKQLEEILSSSSKVAVLVEEIASASKEQTQGVEQVNIGLEQVDQVTQSATASAEECASTSEELSSQAQQLKAMLQSFKLRETKEVKHISEVSPELLEAIKNKLIAENKTVTNKVDLKKTQKIEITKDKGKNTQKKIIDPKEVISLDDKDFGKF